MTGRRRIGETYLLTRTWPDEDTFLFTATRTTPEQNRRQLILDLASWTGQDLRPDDHPSWRSVFDLLWRVREGRPLVIVLDEFQYLARDDEGLADVASALNATYDRQAPARPFALMLSGPAVSTLEALASGDSPLFGRLAAHVRLEPLRAFDVAAFVPAWSLRAKAGGFGKLGGTPAYWAAVDPAADLRSNAAAQWLARVGRLRLQLDTLLAQEEGLGDVSAYTAIIRAVAGGATTRSRIAVATGLMLDHALVRRLDTLVALELLEEAPVVEAPRNAPARFACPIPRFASTTPSSRLRPR